MLSGVFLRMLVPAEVRPSQQEGSRHRVCGHHKKSAGVTRLRRKTLRGIGVVCLVLAVLLVLAFSRSVRIEYHKWRLRAAKADYERLRSGEYQFTDKARELLLAKPVTWEEVRAAGKLHEQKLVEAGFLHRQE